MVIDAQSEQLHVDMALKREEKFRQGVLETDPAQTTRMANAGRLARWPALSHHGIPSATGRGTYASGRSAASPRHYKPPPQVREPAQAGKIPRFRAARH
jgi:hypothetical protein